MEVKISVAEILKDKPQGTKLYANAFGELSIEDICAEDEIGITLLSNVGDKLLFYNDGRFNLQGEPILVPSKEMRNWNKFSWKKGDVLVTENGAAHIIFEKFNDDTYTTFTGKLYYQATKAGCSYAHTRNIAMTQDFDIEEGDAAQTYINTIEEKLGGKLNRETLEVEKTQPEFKDGDIVIQGVLKGINVYIIKNCIDKIDNKYNYYARYNTQDKEIDYNDWSHISPFAKFATDSEKQQLFEALAKEGKHWDAEKKQIVDLKPKYEFKPMDLCLMKYIGKYNNRGWELCQYAYTEHRVSSSGEQRDFYHAVGGEIYAECIPYKGNEHLLGTKKSK